MDSVIEKDWDDLLMGEMLTCGLLSKALYACPDIVGLRSVIDQDVFCDAPFAAAQVDTEIGLRLLHGWSSRNRNALIVGTFAAMIMDPVMCRILS